MKDDIVPIVPRRVVAPLGVERRRHPGAQPGGGLPDQDDGDMLLRFLGLLSRFGLAASAGPLLGPLKDGTEAG